MCFIKVFAEQKQYTQSSAWLAEVEESKCFEGFQQGISQAGITAWPKHKK